MEAAASVAGAGAAEGEGGVIRAAGLVLVRVRVKGGTRTKGDNEPVLSTAWWGAGEALLWEAGFPRDSPSC